MSAATVGYIGVALGWAVVLVLGWRQANEVRE